MLTEGHMHTAMAGEYHSRRLKTVIKKNLWYEDQYRTASCHLPAAVEEFRKLLIVLCSGVTLNAAALLNCGLNIWNLGPKYKMFISPVVSVSPSLA
jgi:hypothetical protein